MRPFFIFFCLLGIYTAQAQTNPIVVSFYNLENLFDTINDPTINDEDILNFLREKQKVFPIRKSMSVINNAFCFYSIFSINSLGDVS